MTQRELLALAYPLHFQRILEHAYSHNPHRMVDIWLSEHRDRPHIDELFIFAHTSEGHRYWASLYYSHRNAKH